MGLVNVLSSLVGNHDDYVADEPLEPGYVAVHVDECDGWPRQSEADAEASVDYANPDSLPAVDAGEDAGLSAVRRLA